MQHKISSFFNPSSSSSNAPPLVSEVEDNELANWEKKEHIIVNTYKRRAPKSDGISLDGSKESLSGALKKPTSADLCLKPQLKTLNKKRSYAQFHLELGQYDFLLRTGVPRVEVIHMPCVEGGHLQVQQVVKRMEIELGTGWIFHKLYKVYLFISSQRIAGCLVVEPIKEAFKVLSGTVDERTHVTSTKKTSVNLATLQFGEIMLQREVVKKDSSVNCPKILDGNHNGAIFCEKETMPAVCGIRAIWVSPSNRRKGIASQLLDAVRRSFCMGFVVEKFQLAFSQPSSAGQALASNYFGTGSFLASKK
ncbi:hypothetical protein ACOSQ2_031883 [Xanthoceras sorbifolium]